MLLYMSFIVVDGRERFLNNLDQLQFPNDKRNPKNHNYNKKIITIEDIERELKRTIVQISRENNEQEDLRDGLGENQAISYAVKD